MRRPYDVGERSAPTVVESPQSFFLPTPVVAYYALPDAAHPHDTTDRPPLTPG